MRRSAIAIGISLVLAGALTAPMLACSCDPPPARPTMQSCDDPAMPATVTAVVPIYTADRGGTEIVDGSEVPIYFGAQGGQHVQLAVRLEGSGFGTCIAQRTELWSLDGVAIESTAANARLTVEGGVATTAPILLFPIEPPSSAILRIEIAGQRIERRLGAAAATDAGADAAP